MRYLKTFEAKKVTIPSSVFGQSKKSVGQDLETDIKKICKKYSIFNYTINSDGSIDVDGDVDLSVSQSKLPLKFRNVSGDFSCSGNELTTLEGCPQTVGGGFYCHSNKLTTLEGCPQSVGDNFDCSDNKLTTLVGCPQTVGGYFDCSDNELTTLEGCAQSVGDNFVCSYNKLTTLEGCAQSVGGYFNCSDNKLTTLVGCPQTVGDFNCQSNLLTTLEGCPQIVGGDFDCRDNELVNFIGFPEDFEGDVYLGGNPVREIYDLFGTVKCIRWINEFDVIQGDSVIMDRLEEVYHQLGMRVINLKSYKIID
jgi:hypothetical protein